MGVHPFRVSNERIAGIPFFVFFVLAAVNTIVVLLGAAPWYRPWIHSPLFLLIALVLGLAIWVLFLVEIVVWQLLRRLFGSAGEPEMLSEGLSAVAISEPAALLIEWIPHDRRCSLAAFDVYVDDRFLCGLTLEPRTPSPVLIPAGRHRVFLRMGWSRSDVVEIDLPETGWAELVCGHRLVGQGRFFRFFRAKCLYVVVPAAIVSQYVPVVGKFIAQHFGVEILAVVFLCSLEVFLAISRTLSCRPGALVYLLERPVVPDSS